MIRWKRSVFRAGFATAVALIAAMDAPAHARVDAADFDGGQSPREQAATGRIVGRILDAQTGRGLTGVVVQVVETGAGVLTGIDGRYAIQNVRAGAITLRVEIIGYTTKSVTGVIVPEGGAVEQDVALEQTAVELESIEVSAGAERGSVNRALDQQRTAIGIVNAITAEQISNSPDGDAAAAMQRVSGVTVQDGKFVHVRGLGERYTTTSLNGARIPSPEPERKVVPLDLFPTSLLQMITTAKTFTPDQPGDFSGGQVDIQTREFPAQRTTHYSFSLGANTRVTGKSLPFAPRTRSEWFAFAGIDRQLPGLVRQAGDFTGSIPAGEMNRLVDAFRNAWSPASESGIPNGSLGVSFGGTDRLFGRSFSYLLSGTWSRSSEVKADEVRAQAIAGPNGSTLEVDRFGGTTGRTSAQWGGLFNASTLIGQSSRILLNAAYNRTADNEARSEDGSSENHGGLPLHIDRLRFIERSVYSAQLRGQHELAASHRFSWAVTASGVERNEPDRSEIVYATQTDPATGALLPPSWFSVSNEGAVRTFGDLSESSIETNADYRLAFGDPVRQSAFRFGAMLRRTSRDSDNRAYSISSGSLNRDERELEPEQIFDGRFTSGSDAILRITPLSQGGSYTAEDRLYAGYGMVEMGLIDGFRVIAGARVERSETDVFATPTIGQAVSTKPSYTDVLPALSLNFRVTDRQNIRLSAAQTLARPEYRELAGIQYREVLGGDNMLGNPGLRRTLIQNLDARWEWYPDAGEVVSLGVFAKRFEGPIERVYLATSGTRVISYVNAESAENYGVELELRKGLGLLGESLESFQVFTNGTLMHSRIRIGDGTRTEVNSERAMVGQAPYVVNAGLTWAAGNGISATLLYNIVGKRIYSAAESPLPEIDEEPRNVIDLSLRFALGEAISAKLDARNLLDEPYTLTQGSVTRESYRAGRVFSIGLSWNR
ncbi:MAG: TonB-dependent receptor [Gemmatimonadetes bacterium]|nr:TonB-dependent receptor [Gemmatimonadota bacterium]